MLKELAHAREDNARAAGQKRTRDSAFCPEFPPRRRNEPRESRPTGLFDQEAADVRAAFAACGRARRRAAKAPQPQAASALLEPGFRDPIPEMVMQLVDDDEPGDDGCFAFRGLGEKLF